MRLSYESKVMLVNNGICNVLYSFAAPPLTKALYETLSQKFFYAESLIYCIGGALITWIWTSKKVAEFVKKHFIFFYILVVISNAICGLGGYIIGGERGMLFYEIISIITNCLLAINISNMMIDIKATCFAPFRKEYDRASLLLGYLCTVFGAGLGCFGVCKLSPFTIMLVLTSVDVASFILELFVVKALIKLEPKMRKINDENI